jgi:hypothetical protein
MLVTEAPREVAVRQACIDVADYRNSVGRGQEKAANQPPTEITTTRSGGLIGSMS